MKRLLLCVALLPLLPTEVMAADPLPSVRLLCSFDVDQMYTKLKAQPLLVNLNKDQYGSPIVLRVTNSTVPTATGMATGLASAIWSGGTLGLLPIVENRDLVITYDLFVNETLLATYSYRDNFTLAKNIYSKDKTDGLGEAGLAWAQQTAEQFSTEAAADPRIVQLIDEYRYYFGSQK